MKLYKNLGAAQKERDNVQALKISVKGENFPEELLDFPNLTELYLDGNCTRFPDKTPKWNQLKTLSIKWPAFKGDLSNVFRLPQLMNLKIIETPMKQFLLPLGNTPAPLKSLTIKDSGLTHLPEEISMLWQMEEMNLSGNDLQELPKSFIDLGNLKRLNLDSNLFKLFPDNVKKMPKLSHLSIDNNKFSDDEKSRIQRDFHIWPN